MDHAGPYVHLLQERLRQPSRLAYRTVPPTAAGALQVGKVLHTRCWICQAS